MSDEPLTSKKTATKKKVTQKKTTKKKTTVAKKVVKKAVTKKAVAKKAVTKKAVASSPPSPEEKSKNTVSPGRRYIMIQEAAYYRAEKRGFEPGWEAQDWADSEKEIDERLKKTR